MNKIINIKSLLATVFVIAGSFYLQSCNDDETYPQPSIKNVRTTAEDAPITTGNFGDWISIQGSGFSSTTEVWFNSVSAQFNPTFVTDNNIVIAVPSDFPEEINDKIKVVTKGGSSEFDFKVIVPAPIVYAISNEFPASGETVEISGDVFYNVQSVVFPGGGEGEIVTYNPTMIQVVVPSGTTSGKLTINAAAGSSESPFELMNKTGMICDYDALNKFEDWGKETVIVDASTNPSDPPVVDGNYIKMQSSIDVGPDSWWVDQTATPHSGIVMPDHPDNDPAENYALKFEYFSVGNFNGGHIQVQFSWGPDYWFEPYKDADGNAGDFVSTNWRTAVIPLNEFGGIVKYGDLKYMDFLLLLLRTPETTETLVDFDMNFDNLRIVKIK